MRKEILNKLTKEGREKIIELEGKLKECELELSELDLLEVSCNEKD